MAGTIKIFGSEIPKPVVFAGAGVIVIGGIYYYRKQKAAGAQAAAVSQAGTNSIDPATGYPYGSPEDAAALQTQANYVSPSGYGYTGYAGGSGTGNFGTGTPGQFLSNAEWAQYVEAYEVNNLGADAPTVGNAIGKYLTGQPLDPNSMVPIIQSAIAIGGYPPVSGPNGNPPNYTTSGGSTNPPTTTPPPVTNPPPVTIPPPTNTQNQTGTVHSATTGENARVSSNDNGMTWNYIGVPPKPGQPKNQVGTVHSDTTGKSAKVTTSDAGLHWHYAG